MVKISKGDKYLMVTHGAFKNFYERQGYVVVKGSSNHTTTGESAPHKEDDHQENKYTPDQIRAMSLDQLYELADHHGINYQKARTKGDLVKLILQSL